MAPSSPRHRVLLRSAGAVLFVAAVVLGWLAFTRFDSEDPPQAGSPAFRDYHAAEVRAAQVSAALGVAAAFALLGALACLQRASGDVSADRVAPPGPPQP